MSKGIEFLAPRLVGERFNNHAIPLEILKELSVLEEMIVEVAKWKYLQDHQDRQRVPRGFTDGISIKMTSIEDGSAIPKLALFMACVTLLPPENQQYFEKARDAIVNSVDAAERDETRITQYLPTSLLVYFDKIGRGLRDNESIEFNPSNQDCPARLNRVSRHKLLEVSTIKEWTEETLERGLIPELDQEKKRFTLQLLNGSKVLIPIEPQHKETVFEAFLGFDKNTRVIVHGIGRYNRALKLETFDSLEHINILDPLDISTRLSELSMLKDGWLDGKGLAPNKTGLDWLSKSFDENFRADLPLPHIYPTPEGGVQAEWTIGTWEVSLEVDLGGKSADFQSVNIKTSKVDETTFDLSNAESWTALNAKIDVLQKESV